VKVKQDPELTRLRTCGQDSNKPAVGAFPPQQEQLLLQVGCCCMAMACCTRLGAQAGSKAMNCTHQLAG
jgi:hypothetical protein